MGKKSANYQINRFIFLKDFCLQGIVCPYPGAIYMCMTIIFKLLIPNDLETRHGPSGTQSLQSGYN